MKRLSDAFVHEVIQPPVPKVNHTTRVADLDAARGAMMLLGLVIHASNIYMLQPWRLNDPGSHFAFDWVNAFIHSFRMESFFWIAGFFASLGLYRRKDSYLRHRLPQLLVPLLTTLLTFNLIEAAVESRWPTPNARVASHGEMITNHLWFLVDLTVFTVLAAALSGSRARLLEVPDWLMRKLQSPIILLGSLTLLTCVPFLGVAAASQKLGIDLSVSLFGATDTTRLLAYLPYFAFGMLVHRHQGIRRVFESIHPGWLLPAIMVDIGLNLYASPDTSWSLIQVGSTFVTWLLVGAVLSLFRRLFLEETALSRWLADASYPMYLAHMLPICLLGTALAQTDWPVGLKFAVVLVGSTAFAAAFAAVVMRQPQLCWLFTGRPLRSGKTVLKGLPTPVASPTSA